MQKNKRIIQFSDCLVIFIGTSLYAFGLASFNMPNHLAEGGVTGITLILKAIFQIDPAYSTLFINIPLILLGRKILGKRTFYYTIIGTSFLSLNLWIWQRIPIQIDIQQDLLIAAILAGLFGGLGSGLVYRVGGTTGGTDIMARILERNTGLSMGKSLLFFDILVLLVSLCYIDIIHMMYTLIATFVFSLLVDGVQDASYAAKGLLIVSQNSQAIASHLMRSLDRGITVLNGQGAYAREETEVLFCVMSAKEITIAKELILENDPRAFVAVLTVNEVLGEGFTFGKEIRQQNKAKARATKKQEPHP